MEDVKSHEFQPTINGPQLHKWVLTFLEGEGGNHSLAKTLREKGRFFLGPIDYSLDSLVPILGPDDSFLFQEDPALTEERVQQMLASYNQGWRPAPLIASDLWEDYFTLADGAHRRELFKKLDISSYPTVFYFRNQASMDTFLQGLPQHIQDSLASRG